MTDTILCVDIGTSSLKAALIPDNVLKSPVFVSRQYFPDSAFTEFNSAKFYLSALKKALSELKEKNPDYAVEAICISGNGPTVISDDGTTLLYSDSLTPSLTVYQGPQKNTKSLFIPRFLGFKSLFNEQWEKSTHIFGCPEFLLHELTGESVTILPEERFLNAYWTHEELKNCGFSDSDVKKIPPFVKTGSFIGKVNEKAALETGLFEGTFVFAGAPDFVVALIGTGTVLPGRLCDRAGTSEGLNLCTSKPVFSDELRTLPSVIPGLWNLSYLLKNKSDTEATEKTEVTDFLRGINLLRKAAIDSAEYFPDYMTITGGKAFDDELIAQKENVSGLKIKKMPCEDAELLGDLILARVALGDYDDITEAVFAILGA